MCGCNNSNKMNTDQMIRLAVSVVGGVVAGKLAADNLNVPLLKKAEVELGMLNVNLAVAAAVGGGLWVAAPMVVPGRFNTELLSYQHPMEGPLSSPLEDMAPEISGFNPAMY